MKLLINYVNEVGLSEEEEDGLCEIISDNNISEKIKIKKITSFSYPHSHYSFGIYPEILFKPSFDGTYCEFSIHPSLPDGIILDKESGLIHGKVKNLMEKKEYEIICQNKISEKKFKVWLEFVIKFTELNKSSGITISDNGKLITKTGTDRFVHCYLNLKIENGIYHIKYRFIKRNDNLDNNDNLMIGLSTDNTYSGNDIYAHSITCNLYLYCGNTHDSSFCCKIGTIVNSNPNFYNHEDGSIYEVIVDMNKKEFSISHHDSSPVLLVKDLPSPLYPYVSIYPFNNSIELLSVSHYIK